MKDKNRKNVSSMETFRKVLTVIAKYRVLLLFSVILAGITVILQLYIEYQHWLI